MDPGDVTAASASPPAAADAVKLSISGASLAALLQRCATAAGDCDGLLFGRASRLPTPTPSLSDYDPSPTPPTPSLSLSISGNSSLSLPSSLSDALGSFQPPPIPFSSVLGFFSSRRSSPLRPSMREAALALSLPKTFSLTHPLVFLLVSSSSSPNRSTHSFDYRAFLLIGSRLVPASLHVVNVGPGFRDQYHAFTAESPMPWLPPPPQQPPAGGYSIGQQKVMEGMVEGFGLERVEGVVGATAAQAAEMEEMYAGMLRRLEGLAREVEKSNARVLEQEHRNLLLRIRYAGLE